MKLNILIIFVLLSALIIQVNAQETDMTDMGHGTEEVGHAMNGESVNWFVILLFLGIIGVLGYFLSNSQKLKKINFLDNTWLKNVLKSKWYPLIFVLPTMIIFAIVILDLLFGNSKASLNFGSSMVWLLLWPVLPLLFLFFGRLWCSVCPMSRVSDEGQKIVGANKKVPKFLQKYGVWLIILFFLIITWSDIAIGLIASPKYTGYLLLFVFVGVVFMGAMYEKRAWCRYLCFLGGLSSNYSMSSALELRANSEICKKCKTPSCYSGNEKVSGCSMFEYPRTMDSNRFCNFCANCIKTCPHDAIKISPRAPTSELWFIKKPRLEDSFLAVALIGIVVSQTVVMLNVWEPFMTWFENTTGITNFIVAWTIIFTGAMAIPIILMLVSSYISSRVSGETLRSNFIRFGYSLIPLGLGIHLAHNTKHFLGEGLFVIYNASTLVGLNIMGNPAILNMPTIQIIQYILSLLGMIGALYTAHKISLNSPNSKTSIMPYVVLILFYGLVALWMYSLPMVERGH